MISPRLPFLDDSRLRLLLFGGKGGVGKTTCAAATALARARSDPGQPYLLVSTDPAHSLEDALQGVERPANLSVLELDPAASLARFRRKNTGHLREIASRGTFLTDDEIDRFLGLSLPGLDELMAFLELTGWIEEGTYRLIVVDTAPTGHTLRLVQMPQLLRQWLLALDALLAKHRYIRAVFSGEFAFDEVDGFLKELSISVEKTSALLADRSASRFVPVLLAEKLSVLETRDLLAELARARVPVSEAVVNRLRPASICPACSLARRRQDAELGTLVADELATGLSFWSLPLHPGEVKGASLEELWDLAEPLDVIGCGVAGSAVREAPRVSRPLSTLPAPDLLPASLLVFAGKGGVGKTTLAAASALRLAGRSDLSRVLLVSCDPAHSVADALDRSVGRDPVPVEGGLWTLEVDAAASLAAFRKLYEDELREFLGGVLRGLDLTFDREVLERLVDLSPPGLDEVMAVAALMDLFSSGQFDLVVLDSAPTGHLVRLLEAPELVEDWLRAFFELLLRYRSVLRMPKTTKALVRFSKELKALRTLLADPSRCGLVAVAIPSRLALDETADLVEACRRLGVDVKGLVLNMVPPGRSDCLFCARRAREGEEMLDRFAASFPALPRAAVFHEGDPRGVPALLELGRRLFPEAMNA